MYRPSYGAAVHKKICLSFAALFFFFFCNMFRVLLFLLFWLVVMCFMNVYLNATILVWSLSLPTLFFLLAGFQEVRGVHRVGFRHVP